MLRLEFNKVSPYCTFRHIDIEGRVIKESWGNISTAFAISSPCTVEITGLYDSVREAAAAGKGPRSEARTANQRSFMADCPLHGQTLHSTARGQCLTCYTTQGTPRTAETNPTGVYLDPQGEVQEAPPAAPRGRPFKFRPGQPFMVKAAGLPSVLHCETAHEAKQLQTELHRLGHQSEILIAPGHSLNET